MVVQRGTDHQWVNASETEWARESFPVYILWSSRVLESKADDGNMHRYGVCVAAGQACGHQGRGAPGEEYPLSRNRVGWEECVLSRVKSCLPDGRKGDSLRVTAAVHTWLAMRELERQSSSRHQAREGQQELSTTISPPQPFGVPEDLQLFSAQKDANGRTTREDVSEEASERRDSRLRLMRSRETAATGDGEDELPLVPAVPGLCRLE